MEDDLSLLAEPINKENVCDALKRRYFKGQNYTCIGSSTIAVTPSMDNLSRKAFLWLPTKSEVLRLMVGKVIQDLKDVQQSQAIVVSGESCMGKAKIFQEIVATAYSLSTNPLQSKSCRQTEAALTVLQPFTATPKRVNAICCAELIVKDNLLLTKDINFYNLPMNRLTTKPSNERSYDIFYYLLHGLTAEEKMKVHLWGHSESSLVYLQIDKIGRLNPRNFEIRHRRWKESLTSFGINYAEVVRILSAVLLLGNISIVQGSRNMLYVSDETELSAVAELLEITSDALVESWTVRNVTHGKTALKIWQSVKKANELISVTAQSLFSRLFQYIQYKINTSFAYDACSERPNGIGQLSKVDKVKNGTVISRLSLQSYRPSLCIMNCFGFDNCKSLNLEALIRNLCAEAIQHFYMNMHFNELQSTPESVDICHHNSSEWQDNTQVIQLLSNKTSGIVKLLHLETVSPTPRSEGFMENLENLTEKSENVKVEKNKKSFTIRHYDKVVRYDARDLITENLNALPDEIVILFHHKNTRNKTLAELFLHEIDDMRANGFQARGKAYRITPCPNNLDVTSPSSHAQDFLCCIDSLMQSLSSCNPCFVRCVKLSSIRKSSSNGWDDLLVQRQISMLHITETVKVLSVGFPHRLLISTFVNRYSCLTCERADKFSDTLTTAREIMASLLRLLSVNNVSYKSASWQYGPHHIFLSEETIQCLDMMKMYRRNLAAIKIQAFYRGWKVRRLWCISLLTFKELPPQCHQISLSKSFPDSGKNDLLRSFINIERFSKPKRPNDFAYSCDNLLLDISRHTKQERGLPTISSSNKPYLEFPHFRIITDDIDVDGYSLSQGCEVICIGLSERDSHICISYRNDILDIPESVTYLI